MKEIVQRFPNDGYVAYHAPRYSVLLELLQRGYQPGQRVLDIGRSKFTLLAAEALNVSIDTLGFPVDTPTESGEHYHFDLNDSQYQQRWRQNFGLYDVVVFAEVIEHLYTSPSLVLAYIYSITAPGGCVLLQTPNAVVLHKRIKMLLGRNPSELISEDNRNPGHFREYTKLELNQYANAAGFDVEQATYGNYFDYRYAGHVADPHAYKPHLKLVNYCYSICPSSLKPGLTLVLRKPGHSIVQRDE